MRYPCGYHKDSVCLLIAIESFLYLLVAICCYNVIAVSFQVLAKHTGNLKATRIQTNSHRKPTEVPQMCYSGRLTYQRPIGGIFYKSYD